jgi:hypothetical protein
MFQFRYRRNALTRHPLLIEFGTHEDLLEFQRIVNAGVENAQATEWPSGAPPDGATLTVWVEPVLDWNGDGLPAQGEREET